MDAREGLRKLPLMLVLDALIGEMTWKARKNGTEWYGRCPIHEAKRNTTSFSFDDEGKFHCFSCQAKGKGAIDLVMAIRQVGFRDACAILEELKPTLTGRIPSPDLVHIPAEMPTISENAPFKGSYEKFAVASPWLTARGFTQDTLDQFEVFQYDNPKRKSAYSGSVMLKIRRWSDSEAVGYLSRNIGEITPEKPKYRFPAGFQRSLELFGAHQLSEKAPVRVLYIVESPFAVMKFHQLGLPAVSPFGFTVSAQQVAIIGQIARGIVFLPDRNKFAEVGPSVALLARACWVKTPMLPDGVDDPEHLSLEQVRNLTGSS